MSAGPHAFGLLRNGTELILLGCGLLYLGADLTAD